MKFWFYLVALLFATSSLTAQNLQLEVFSGISFARVREKVEMPPAQDNDFRYLKRAPFGALIDVAMSNDILVETGLIYSPRGTKIYDSRFELNYMDIPVNVVVSPKNFRVFFGPVISILTGASFDGANAKEAFEKSDWGFRYGIGTDIKRLSLRFTIHNGMVDAFKDTRYKWRSNSMSFTLGFLIVKRKIDFFKQTGLPEQIHRKL